MRALGWICFALLAGWLVALLLAGERSIEQGLVAARDGAGRVH
jgi:hypothetical protein